MALPEDPNQSLIYVIAMALAGAVIGIWEAVKRIAGNKASTDQEKLRDRLCRDISKIEAKIDRAVEHADETHKEMFTRLNRVETSIAVLQSREKGR